MRGSAWPATWPFLPRGLPTAGWRWRHRCSVPSGRSRVPGCCLQSRGLPAARLPEHACPRCPRCPGCRGSPAAGGREGLRPALPRPVRAEQPQLAAARWARGCAQGARVLLVVQWSPCQVTVGVRWPPRSLVDCTGTISSSAGAGDRQHSPGGGGACARPARQAFGCLPCARFRLRPAPPRCRWGCPALQPSRSWPSAGLIGLAVVGSGDLCQACPEGKDAEGVAGRWPH